MSGGIAINPVSPADMSAAIASAMAALPRTGVLWSLAADMNSTADQAFIKAFAFTNFTIDKIIVTGASASLTTAVGGIYGAASKSAPVLVLAAQTYTALSSATKVVNPNLQAAAGDLLSVAALYLSLTTPQGAASTANFYIMGTAWS